MKNQAPLIYVYGFTAASPTRHAPRATNHEPRTTRCVLDHGVEEDIPVECLEHQGICALVSRVPSAVYEEKPLQKHVQDACWLALRVERHNRALLQVLERSTVVPCRFGTLFRSVAALEEALARNHAALSETLKRLDGRVEYAVKGIFDSQFWTHDLRDDHAAKANRKSRIENRKSGGSNYLLGLVRKRNAERQACRQTEDHARRIAAAVTQFAEQVIHLPLPKPEIQNPKSKIQNREGAVFLNLACLVRKDALPALANGLAKLAAREKRNHITIAWSGPWPAYSFAAATQPAAHREENTA